MIQFPCQNCGTLLSQAEKAVGTLVFCECGQVNRVPPESLAPALEPPRAVDEWAARFNPPAEPPDVELADVVPLALDPNSCLNHPQTRASETCESCGERFCDACLVTLEQRRLCGPCKNFRLRVLQRPTRVSGLAVTSALVSLGMGVCGHCLLFMGAGSQQVGMAYFSVVPQVAALVLGIFAVRQVETEPRAGGRALVMTGLLAAFVLTVELILFAMVIRRQIME